MSRLRDAQCNPTNLLNTAKLMFKSKGEQTIVVEGVTDKFFLEQWCKEGASIRFAGMRGKELVEKIYQASKHPHYSDLELFFFADVDFDNVAGVKMISDPRFIYNAFCHHKSLVEYNDLEAFLINNGALEKVLINHGIDRASAPDIKRKLEAASRYLGSLRAADIVTVKAFKLSSSILNSFEIEPFFDARNLVIDQKAFEAQLPYWSNNKNYVEDLLEEAEKIEKANTKPWALSRGHDLTEMLALHLEQAGSKGMRAERVESMLRMACELATFKASPMGRKLASECPRSFIA
ncbi:hypothetical protein [Pseudomonas taiwanensis]|uniref:hypothetical protein n=1 Tax=Pseudomonas taiwanensis TaxID=470150 RepID=UPI00048521F1|nr:hypothetical protein [Pseudomonas taiwanensis]